MFSIKLHVIINTSPMTRAEKFKMDFPTNDQAVQVYRECSSAPGFSSAVILKAGREHTFRIHSTWSQRDLERESNVKFSRTHLVTRDPGTGKVSEILDAGNLLELNSEQLVQWSPSGQLKAVLRKVKDKKGDEKQYLEVWNTLNKIHNVNLTAQDKHGKVNEDGEFGCLEWSSDETKLLYVAEKKQPKAASYFEKKKDDSQDESKEDSTTKKDQEVKGDQFLYRQDWGETLVGKHCPVPCILDLQTQTVSVPEGLPDDTSIGQAVWTPEDGGIVFVGWQNEPYRLGVVFCRNRKNALYHLDLASKTCTAISVVDQSVRSPRFSPDGSRLVYMRNRCHGPHGQCAELMRCNWSSKETRVAVNIVHKPADAAAFQGLYVGRLDGHCWLDNERIITSTLWRSNKTIVIANTSTGEVSRLTNGAEFGSWTLCDVNQGLILAHRASPVNSGQLVIGIIPKPGEVDIAWRPLHEPCVNCSDVAWSIIKLRPHSDQKDDLDFEAIILKPIRDDEKSKLPFIVWPHGGPHSAFASDYLMFCAAFARLGFVVALVNYRGSLGFGQASIDSLPGNVGTNDVQDVHVTAEEVIRQGLADPDRVAMSGGSHGGFLSTHMIGQYPDFYKACVTRNPVTNVAAMHGGTDIASWTMTEAGFDFEFDMAPSPEIYAKMFSASPMAHVDKVKAPTLVMLGSCDLRVPPQQGLSYHHMLKARGVKTRLLMYPDNTHGISKVDAEADCFINMYSWLAQHL